MAYNGAGLCAGGELNCVCPQPLLIENMLLSLRTKVECCLSSPNYSLDLQFAKPHLHKASYVSGCFIVQKLLPFSLKDFHSVLHLLQSVQ